MNALGIIFMACVSAVAGSLYDPKECKTSREGAEYMGEVSVTSSGIECQRWDTQEPHQHDFTNPRLFPDADFNEVSNFCRNPDLKLRPWCYTTDENVTFAFCDIPWCERFPDCDAAEGLGCKPSATCTTTVNGEEYVGKRGITTTGRPCQRWDRQSPHTHTHTDADMFPDLNVSHAENFCRNPDGLRNGVWCYTTDPDQEWEYCDIPVCSGCRQSVDGRGYMGTEAVTSTGTVCQPWASHSLSPELFPDMSLEAAENYCRNPTAREGGLWCYVGAEEGDWDYCDVPLCEEDCASDSLDRRTVKHVLHIGIDGLHASCWQNSSSGGPNLLRFASEGSYSYKARGEIFTFSAPNWSAHLCGMGNEETGATYNSWEAPWMGKEEAITPVTGLNYPMPCVFYYLKGMDANIRTASFINWPWIYEMSGRNSPGSTDVDFYCRGTPSWGQLCDRDVTDNVTEYMQDIVNYAERSYTFVHLDELDGRGHSFGWCTERYLNYFDIIDGMVGEMLDAVEGLDVLVVLSSDHGGTDGHGDQVDEHLLIPLFFKGPGIKENYELQGVGRNRDIVPTITWAMGLKGSPYWYSDVLYEIFE